MDSRSNSGDVAAKAAIIEVVATLLWRRRLSVICQAVDQIELPQDDGEVCPLGGSIARTRQRWRAEPRGERNDERGDGDRTVPHARRGAALLSHVPPLGDHDEDMVIERIRRRTFQSARTAHRIGMRGLTLSPPQRGATAPTGTS